MNVNGVMNVHPSTAAYRALKVSDSAAVESAALSNAATNVYECSEYCKKENIIVSKYRAPSN